MKYKVTILILISIGAFSLILLGVSLGKVTDIAGRISVVWGWLVDSGTILAGFGTIAASYVGYLALHNWKSQSKDMLSLTRLLENQENVAVLCCEFLDRTKSLMGEEKEEYFHLIKKTEYNFSILSRQVSKNEEILEMKKLIFMPKVRIRDCGVLWDPEKKELKELEDKLNKYIKNR